MSTPYNVFMKKETEILEREWERHLERVEEFKKREELETWLKQNESCEDCSWWLYSTEELREDGRGEDGGVS